VRFSVCHIAPGSDCLLGIGLSCLHSRFLLPRAKVCLLFGSRICTACRSKSFLIELLNPAGVVAVANPEEIELDDLPDDEALDDDGLPDDVDELAKTIE
jgi:hypothetical protein